MTETEIIRQLIMSNWYQDFGPNGEPSFALNWKWTKLVYAIGQEDESRTLQDMLDWFYDKVIQLAHESNKEHH